MARMNHEHQPQPGRENLTTTACVVCGKWIRCDPDGWTLTKFVRTHVTRWGVA